jgi:hypothetical protein
VTHGAAASSAFPDAGAIEAARPVIAATETSKKAIPFIVAPFTCDFYTSFAASDRKPSPSMLNTGTGISAELTLEAVWKSKRIVLLRKKSGAVIRSSIP